MRTNKFTTTLNNGGEISVIGSSIVLLRVGIDREFWDWSLTEEEALRVGADLINEALRLRSEK